jgi:surface protein
MGNMFSNSKFIGDISAWNVSNVNNMGWMFMNSKFNNDISNWDVSNVTNMECMFMYSKFNNDISNWDVSRVSETRNIFFSCPIDKNYKPAKFRKLLEGFDFDSTNKDKKLINVHDVLHSQIKNIVDKIVV